MKWPQHYTTNGNTNIEGDVKNMKFAKSDPILTFEVTYRFTKLYEIEGKIRFDLFESFLIRDILDIHRRPRKATPRSK